MKNFRASSAFAILGVSFLASVSAHAFPEVGDSVTYNITITSSQGVAAGTITDQILAVDASGQGWEVQQTLASPPSVSDQDDTDVPLEADISEVLGECAQAGGTPQTLAVPAGTFSTCAVPVNDPSSGTTGTIWIGLVPFGAVQVDFVQNGATVHEVLASYSVGTAATPAVADTRLMSTSSAVRTIAKIVQNLKNRTL